MASKNAVKILSVVLAVYAVMLVIGFFILQQILLSILIATALLLVGALVYFVWRYRGDSNGNRDSQSL